MIDAKLVRAIRMLALQSVEEPTDEDTWAKVCRFYSITFNTPLYKVEELDPVHVLTHFFQHKYETLANGSENDVRLYEEEKASLLWPEELSKKLNDDDDWVKKLEAEMAEGQAEDGPKDSGEVVKEAMDNLNLIPEDLKLPDSGDYSG
jgi:hypothetical protein